MALADEDGVSFWVPGFFGSLAAGMQGYLNLKAYKEVDNANRLDGWNAWVTLVLSPAPAAAESSPQPILTKTPPRS
jgi:hypothetical protein